eukprot:CAMPEP_0180410480 /NCGR_PEP_ID=MMETSP0989-20121125/43439_1 /TAXON_ID=697907 /ORGANISM="non described non described, Strain CCMP2293" /LENGTH=85 /DNA_ID=CAMNT_0022414701 /DNA_START=22 /DNA_END=275 /DNA_ORIENTATION=-
MANARLLARLVTSARSSAATWMCPCASARPAGVSPWSFPASASTPASSSILATSCWPLLAAQCSGVIPEWLGTAGSAPASSSIRT